MRVEFRLTMPGVSTWSGRWSGESRNYTIVERLSKKALEKLKIEPGKTRTWFHDFGDGWCAQIDARVMEKGERAKKSDGFYGYDWMVRSILEHGKIKVRGSA